MSESRPADRFAVSSERSLPVVAAVAMLAWVLLEFAFRRGLVPALAEFVGSGRGADALILAFGFPLVAVVVAWWGAHTGIDRSRWDYELSLRTVGAGLGGAVAYFAVFAALAVILTSVLDVSPSFDGGVLGVTDAPTWALIALLVGNGLVVPVTEELAWRGVIQTALTESYGVRVAVVVTAAAFVAKHLVVDLAAPPFRVASLVVGAFVLCGVRARYGTASSTVTHLITNLIATASLVLA